MNSPILDQCVAASFDSTMTFPEIVSRLMAEHIEWYSANLLFGVTTYYTPDGGHHQVKWPMPAPSAIADAFASEKVLSAIRASQLGEINYPEFLRRIAEAGTVYYTVHLRGKKALYFGRHGDHHTELFPAAKD